METYLQTAWGDQWDDVTMDIVKIAIDRLREMDDEHGAFWVGLVNDNESVLELNKDLTLAAEFEDEPGTVYKGQAANWEEIETLFKAFLLNELKFVKDRLMEKR